MKVIILAAGKGSRLGENDLPKPLTCLIDGKSILEHQIEALQPFLSRDSILVVVGFHKEYLMEAFSDLLFVYNSHFNEENTSKSLLKALKKIDEDLLWINGDVLFHPKVIKKILSANCNCMAVTEGVVGEEEVKYQCDAQGKIYAVSKTIEQGQGEAIGVNFFKAESLPLLRQQLEACLNSDYYEKAIEGCISAGLAVYTCPVAIDLCREIDFPSDIQLANQLLKSWQAFEK